jgi:hypothetical protein
MGNLKGRFNYWGLQETVKKALDMECFFLSVGDR